MLLLLAEEVGPGGVEAERVVGEQADHGEEGKLGRQQESDTAEHGAPVRLGQAGPEPNGEDEQCHRDDDGKKQHFLAGETHVVLSSGRPGHPYRWWNP